MKKIKTFSLALLMLISYQIFGQERIITGTVSDKNEKLPFVTVNIKGTQKAVQTDIDGKFSIKAKKGDKLIFSFLGYVNYEQEIGEKVSDYQIILKSIAILLEETYGYDPKVKKKNLPSTTVISSVEELKKPVEEKDSIISKERESNLVNALSGKIAGVTITNSSGSNGSSSRIVFNCEPTITGKNEALFVINGMPIDRKKFDSKTAINPDDIKSISVLKGNEAIKLYGEKAKNGVIIITTKKLSKKQIRKLKKLSKEE